MTPEQWTQILTISPAAACVILVVVLFLKYLKGRDATFDKLVTRIDQSQAARDERITNAIDANTRTTAEIHGLLLGRAAGPSKVHINGVQMAGTPLTIRPPPPWSPGPEKPESES